MPAIQMRAPDGRGWRVKEIAQGKPLGHPSHALFVHFPAAFYIGALAFDLLSHLRGFESAPLAATWLTIGALGGGAAAAVTGLIDWWSMVPGSTKRRWATRHMVLQLGAAVSFAITLALRWPVRRAPHTSVAIIAVEAAAVVLMIVGNWIGGSLVYEMGMRVSTGRSARKIQAPASASSPSQSQ